MLAIGNGSKGICLKKATLNKMFFEKKEPQKIVYYIKEAKEGEVCPEKTELEHFNANGLKYVYTIKNQLNNQRGYCHIYCGDKFNYNNCYQVWEGEGCISERIFKEIQTQEFFSAISPLILFGSIVYTSKESILYWFIKSDLGLLSLFISIISISRLLLCMLKFFDFKKNIHKIIDRKSYFLRDYLKLKRGINILKWFLFVFIIIAISNSFYSIRNNEEVLLVKKTILSPIQYRIKDALYINGEDEEDGITINTIEYYELTFKVFVAPYINALLNNQERDSVLNIEEIDSSIKLFCFDDIRKKEKKMIIQNNKSILYVKYEGEGTATQDVENVMKKLKGLKEEFLFYWE